MSEVGVSVQGAVTFDRSLIERWGQVALQSLALNSAELSVLLCDDSVIRPLNRDWRQKDQPTDVLSFAQQEGESMGDRDLLGDIVISVQTAQRQAQEVGHNLESEMQVLLVHGLCHLLGYDHLEPAEGREMAALEMRILNALGGGEGLVHRALVLD